MNNLHYSINIILFCKTLNIHKIKQVDRNRPLRLRNGRLMIMMIEL